jgi:hypothetical protein
VLSALLDPKIGHAVGTSALRVRSPLTR